MRYVGLLAGIGLLLAVTGTAEATTYTVGPGQTYTTIQAGIDAASANDTVFVLNGTYGADPATGRAAYIDTTKNGLTLTGQSQSGTIIDGSIGGVGTSGSYWPKGVHVQANNVTISNLTVQGFTGDLSSTGGYGVLFRDYGHDTPGEGYIYYSGGTIENVTSQNNCYPMYALVQRNLTIDSCLIQDNLGDGMFIARECDNATITDNTVLNSGDHGIWVGNCWMGLGPSDNATITGNTVNGAREGGISFVGSDTATIEWNLITNAAGDGWSVGALSLKDGPSNVSALYNDIYANDGAWGGYAGTGHGVGIDGTPSNILLNYNNIYDNAGYEVYNYSTVEVNAEYNWWGDASGPTLGDDVSDYVDYEPYLSQPIPEPVTMAGLMLGIGCLARYVRRRKV